MDVPYSEQLMQKDARIAKLFDGLAPDGSVRSILGMDVPFNYRNKIIAPFVPARKGAGKRAKNAKGPAGKKSKAASGKPQIATGMYARGTHRVIEADGCVLENEIGAKVVRAIKAIMTRHGMQPYDEDAGTGFMRHAVIRVGHSSGEVFVTLVTNSDEFPYAKSFCRELVRRVPEVTTIVQSVNTRKTNVVMGDSEKVLYGPGFILDRLCGLSFRISSGAFYQVNSRQTEVLYKTAVELAGLQGDETVVDAYCGTGTIGLVAVASCGRGPKEEAAGVGARKPGVAEAHPAAPGAVVAGAAAHGGMTLVGIDSEASAIRDARQNAGHNGIFNAIFVAADAAEFLALAAQGDVSIGTRPAGSHSVGSHSASKKAVASDAAAAIRAADSNLVLFMDPPRSGATTQFLDAVASLRPNKIVYISCNPETQVRDIRRLVESGFDLKVVQPVDMFPHTPHIECVASLEDCNA